MTDNSYSFQCFDMRTELQKQREQAIMYLSGGREFCREAYSAEDIKRYDASARALLKYTVAEDCLRTLLERSDAISPQLAEVSVQIANKIVDGILPVTSPAPAVTVFLMKPESDVEKLP